MGNNFKRFSALLAAGALCAATGYLGAKAYAASYTINGRTDDEFVYLQDDLDKIVSFGQGRNNFFGTYGYGDKVPSAEIYVPGDTITGQVDVSNKTSYSVHIYLHAANTTMDKFSAYHAANADIMNYTASELYNKSAELISKINLKIDYKDASTGARTTIYDAKMDGDGAITDSYFNTTLVGSTTNKMKTVKAIDLGVYNQGAEGTLYFTLSIPNDIEGNVITDADTGAVTSKSGYSGTVAMIDWVFNASYEDPPPEPTTEPTTNPPTNPPTEPTTQPPTVPPTVTTTTDPFPEKTATTTAEVKIPPPRTGEAAMPYLVGTVFCGVSAIAIILIVFFGKRNDDDEETA